MQLSKHFTSEDLVCGCGNCDGGPREYLLQLAAYLEDLRIAVGVPLHINSGYRCLQHPIEAAKEPNSVHAHAKHFGVDISAALDHAYDIVVAAPLLGWRGVGVKAKGEIASRFVHLDRRPAHSRRLWSYA